MVVDVSTHRRPDKKALALGASAALLLLISPGALEALRGEKHKLGADRGTSLDVPGSDAARAAPTLLERAAGIPRAIFGFWRGFWLFLIGE